MFVGTQQITTMSFVTRLTGKTLNIGYTYYNAQKMTRKPWPAYGSTTKEVVALMTILSRKQLAPEDPRHGTANAYNNWDCRCRPCKDAWATYIRARNEAKRAA